MGNIQGTDTLRCADCNTELLIPYQLGKRKKDRKLYCGKCARRIKNERRVSKS